MAKFITEDLSGVTIMICNTMVVDGVHDCYRITTKDENEFLYGWDDKTTPSDANQTVLEDAIKTHMLTLEKFVPFVEPVVSSSKRDDVIGNSLG